MGQSARSCCADYWLGMDGNRYEAAVAGMDGWRYAGLKSRVSVQRYGLRLNVNLLGFFPKTRYSRWSLELSPHIAAVGTKSTIQTMSGADDALKGDPRWHLGAGGNVQAAYRLMQRLSVGIYSGITCLTGDAMTGMPEHFPQLQLHLGERHPPRLLFGRQESPEAGRGHTCRAGRACRAGKDGM